MKSIFNEEQINYLKNNYNKKTYKELANNLGFTERQIRGKINNMGLSKLRKFNDEYFKVIDSCEKAYWLGFLYADGYIVNNKTNRNYELGIELNINDIQVLKDFNKALVNVHKIQEKINKKNFNGYTYKTHTCILRVYSKQIVEDLMKLNILPNKTYKKEYPKCDKYFYDFLRGFLDGDGCVYKNKNVLYVKFTNSNYNFLKYIKNRVEDDMKINMSIYKENDNKYNLYATKKEDCKKILEKLYEVKNCQKLDRKYELYKANYGSPT